MAHIAASNDALWSALGSPEPVAALIELVKEWKVAGAAKAEVEHRLTEFLHEVMATGAPDQDDPVRDVLDYVVGYCSPDARLFP